MLRAKHRPELKLKQQKVSFSTQIRSSRSFYIEWDYSFSVIMWMTRELDRDETSLWLIKEPPFYTSIWEALAPSNKVCNAYVKQLNEVCKDIKLGVKIKPHYEYLTM